MPDLEKQKQEFLTLCRENIKRDGLEDLLGWLQKSDFFTAPASTRYHGAYEGGLCEHSLDVYHMAKKAIAGYALELTEESVSENQRQLAGSPMLHNRGEILLWRARLQISLSGTTVYEAEN